MAFLAPAAAAAGAGTAAATLPGMVGATLAAPGVAAMTTGASSALGTGLLAGSGMASGILSSANLAALGGLSSLPGAAGATGLASIPLAGTTAALEPLKGSIISSAMESQAANLAAKNALMQQAATGVNPLIGGAAQRGLVMPPGATGYVTGGGMPTTFYNAAGNALPQAGLPVTPSVTPSLAPSPAEMFAVPTPEVTIKPLVSTPKADIIAQSMRDRGFIMSPPAAATPVPPAAVTPPPTFNPIGVAPQAGGSPFMAPQQISAVPEATVSTVPRTSPIVKGETWSSNLGNLLEAPSWQGTKEYAKEHPYATAAGAYGISKLLEKKYQAPERSPGMIRPYTFERTQRPEAYAAAPGDTSERLYFNDTFTAQPAYEAPGPEYKAAGGIARLAVGGPVETMAAMNSVGANTGYPMAGINTPMYANPMMQRPEAVNVISPSGDAGVGAYSGEPKYAGGGIADLGGYSDGGRLLKGPGDGVSDSIPAVIGNRQPARLADGEFVIPSRIVSELGNGSTDAGARKLYAMMDRIQKGRRKSVGKDRVAVDSKAEKHLPA